RDRADRGGAWPAARPDLDAQRDGAARRGEDVQVGGQHPLAAGRAPGEGPRRADHVLRGRPLPRAAGVLRGGAGGGQPRRGACARARGGARGARLRGGRRQARRAGGSRLGGPRHARGAAASAPAVIVYGRNPVREALRGRRKVERVWAAASAAREEWLGGVGVETADGAELERLCGSPDHQGICAQAAPYPYADPGSLLTADDALVLVLDQIQDPRNLG